MKQTGETRYKYLKIKNNIAKINNLQQNSNNLGTTYLCH